MEEITKFLIGIVVLLLGFPIGRFLARITKEELKSGRKWFRLGIILLSVGAVISLIIRNDVLLFTFLFMVIVISESMKSKKSGKKDDGK